MAENKGGSNSNRVKKEGERRRKGKRATERWRMKKGVKESERKTNREGDGK